MIYKSCAETRVPLLPIPEEILKPFDAVMEQKPIPLALRTYYREIFGTFYNSIAI